MVTGSGTSRVLVTHDLRDVAGLCDTVHVMYAGRVVESAPRRPLFADPRHPYTGGLLGSVPRLDAPRGEPLRPIPGSPTDTLPWVKGCAFAPRCAHRVDACTGQPPPLEVTDDRSLRCVNPLAEGEASPNPAVVPPASVVPDPEEEPS